MPFMRSLLRPATVLLLLAAALFTYSCSEDEGTNPPAETTDYFPYGYNYRWTYTSTCWAEKGMPVVEFEMKIDTATSWFNTENRGLFDFIMIRSSAWNNQWFSIFASKILETSFTV